MIVCRKCGAESAEDDDFCGTCGDFLEWSGERVGPEPVPEPEPEPEPEHKPTLVERVKTAIGIDESAAAAKAQADAEAAAKAQAEAAAAEAAGGAAEAPAPAPAATSTPAPSPAPVPAPAPTAGAGPEDGGAAAPAASIAAGGDAGATDAADATTVSAAVTAPETAGTAAKTGTGHSPQAARGKPAPVTTAQPSEAALRAAAHVAKERPKPVKPTEGQPAAQKPGVGKRPPRPQTPVRKRSQLKPGDLVCGDCGEGNDPQRKFCRRCGHTLAEAQAVKISWWRRLWRWLSRPRKKSLEAGDRPKKWGGGTKKRRSGSGVGRGLRRIMMMLIPLMILAGYVGPFRPSVRGLARTVSAPILDRVRPPQDPVRPTAATASSTAPGHDPKSAIDGVRTTHWSEGAPGDGEGQGLILTFDEPVDINKMGFTLGGSSKPEDFQSHPRPKDVHLVFSDGSTKDVKLKDQADFQRVSVKARDVTSVQVQIVSVYRSLQGSSECSFAEIELFGSPS